MADATICLDALTAAQSDSLPERIGGWLIQRRLGAGAMGEVYLAQRDGRRAALKLVAKRFAGDEAFHQRFQREIALLSRFDHANVAHAYDGGEHDGRPWLAMEFVDGPNLQDLLAGRGPFFETEVLLLAMQVARGLQHIHAQAGLIHRDVKPDNVLVARAPGGDPARLLNPGDVAKLIDFGLAKPAEEEGQGLTMTGMIMGTPNYIAPEQVACERNLTLHVDMYALGATMFHLLTGRVPFDAGSAAAVMAAHLNSPVPDPGQVVPSLSGPTRKLVMTTMAKKVSQRYADWNAFIAACEKAITAATQATAKRQSSSSFRRPPSPSTSSVRRAEAGRGSSSGSRSTAKPLLSLAAGPALEPRAGTTAPVPVNGADALRAAVTSRIIKVQTSSVHRRPTTGMRSNAATTSAVNSWSGRLESAGTTGGSILPWLTLGLAALLAVGAAVWALGV